MNGLCFVGFDGFIDEIIHPAEKRNPDLTYSPFPSMEAFSHKIKKAAGKSCNIELVVQGRKIGGNGPILATALLEQGNSVAIAGTFGENSTHPIFLPLKERASTFISLGEPGFTDALEFSDGKIILGKLAPLQTLSYVTVLEKIGKERLFQILEESVLFVSANWTMLPMMNALWLYIIEEVAPKLSPKKRHLFVDLADPAKRSDPEIHEALVCLKRLNQTFEVTLGLNHSEARRLSQLIGENPENPLKDLTLSLLNHLKLSCIVVHSAKNACAAKTFPILVDTFYTDTPKILTGAGDNFNAGFCQGLLLDLSLEETLRLANGTAGFYIRNGKSPTPEELAIFLRSWDNIKV